MMNKLINGEWIKGKGLITRSAPVLMPAVIALLAMALMAGPFVQINSVNWWYVILAPVAISLICANVIEPDSRLNWQNINMLPYKRRSAWDAKIIVGLCLLLAANIALLLVTTLAGFVYGSMYSIQTGLFSALILVVTFAWMVPTGMFLTSRFGSGVCFVALLVLGLGGAIQNVSGGSLWFLPMALPARLMAAMIGVNPNGTLLEANSPLADASVILPGLLISVVTFIAVYSITRIWFAKKGGE